MFRKINFTFVSALMLAGMSLYFSAHGLVSLFRGAPLAIILFAGVMEWGKVIATIEILRRRSLQPITVLLGVALFLMVSISTVGIWSYLGTAYTAPRKTAVVGRAGVESAQANLSALEADRAGLYRMVEEIPPEHSTNRGLILAQIQPQVQHVDSMIVQQRAKLAALQTAQAGTDTDIGQLEFAAAQFGVSGDRLARWVIAVLSFLLDPLAVLLVLASGVHFGHSTRDASGDGDLPGEPGVPVLTLLPEEAAPMGMSEEKEQEAPPRKESSSNRWSSVGGFDTPMLNLGGLLLPATDWEEILSAKGGVP